MSENSSHQIQQIEATQTQDDMREAQGEVADGVIQPTETTKPRKQKNTSKPPPNADRLPGKSLLPTARVQKIMKADKELPSCNKEAVFLISIATEEFIKRLGLASQRQADRDKRTTVQRKDLVTAVRRSEEFVFLEELLAATAPTTAFAPATKKKPKNSAALGSTIKDALAKGEVKGIGTQNEDADKMNTS